MNGEVRATLMMRKERKKRAIFTACSEGLYKLIFRSLKAKEKEVRMAWKVDWERFAISAKQRSNKRARKE